jgi:DNA-binding transcriptional regulator YiaG
LTISDIPPDLPNLTTTERLLELIHIYPNGLTIKELADSLNRPVSMVQICLKILIANRQVVVRQRNQTGQIAKVYIPIPVHRKPKGEFQLTASQSSSGLTPTGLREVAGLTKAEIAAELGLTVRIISDWEQKRSQPKLVPSQLKQMMMVYQCTLDELIAAFE